MRACSGPGPWSCLCLKCLSPFSPLLQTASWKAGWSPFSYLRDLVGFRLQPTVHACPLHGCSSGLRTTQAHVRCKRRCLSSQGLLRRGKNRCQHPRVARAPCQGQQREAPHPAAHPGLPLAPTCRSFSVCPLRTREAGAFSAVAPRPPPGANILEVKERRPCPRGGNRERNKYFRLRQLQRLASRVGAEKWGLLD